MPPSVRDMHGPPPTRIGDFEIARELGRGSMGIVYEAIQLSLGRRVALKTFPAHGKTAHQLERFRREAGAAAKLLHPGIVPVFAVGEDKVYHYYAMQLVDGKTLRELIYTDKISVQRAAQIGKRIAEALDYAHSQGVIHRDIKPANIIVTPGDQPVITDFGLAKDMGLSAMTVAGVVLGTPTHMSPEQAGGSAHVDHRTDIYALGACLYEMSTYRLPFYGENLEELLDKVAKEEPPRPRSVDKRIPRELEAIILQCLSKDPAERYATAGELAADLDRFLKGEPVLARRPSPLKPLVIWVGKNRRAAASIGFGAAVLLAATAYFAADAVATRAMTTRLLEELGRARADRNDAGAAQIAEKILEVDPANDVAQKAKLELAIAREQAQAEQRRAKNRAEAEKHVKTGHAAVERARSLEGREADRALDEALDAYGRALGLDPENVAARTGRGRIYLQRAIAAERHGDLDLAEVYFGFVRQHNPDGFFDRQLRSEGSLEVRVGVPGAKVALFRVHPDPQSGETRREPVGEGGAPYPREGLAVGSYLVEAGAEGYAPALVPVSVERDVREDLDVRLLRDYEIPPGFAYIPAGPVRLGGDPHAIRALPRERRKIDGFFIALHEVTCAEYVAFLNDLAAHDAKALVPRGERGREVFWPDEAGKYLFPRTWPPERPVTGVSYEAAVRYAAWRAAREKRPIRLPTEIEWEKAARGADGRTYPWGEAAPEGRSNIAIGAEPGQAKPVGTTPGDVSIHGVTDLIGNASEWTSSVLDTRLLHRIVRGGSYKPHTDPPRAAARFPTEVVSPPEHTGFRLACDLPE